MEKHARYMNRGLPLVWHMAVAPAIAVSSPYRCAAVPRRRAAGGGVRGCGVAFLCWLRDGGGRGGRCEGAVLLQRLPGPDAHIVGHAAPRDRGGFDGLE